MDPVIAVCLLIGAALAQVPGDPGPSALVVVETGPWSTMVLMQGETGTLTTPVSLAVQASASWLSFTYQGASGPVSARGPGMAIGFGARWRPPAGSVGAFVRLEGRLTYEVPGLPPEALLGPGVGVDVWWRVGSRAHVSAVGLYNGPGQYVWTRAEMGVRVADFPSYPPKTLSVGGDVGARGTAGATGAGTGARVALGVPRRKLELALRGGPEWTWDTQAQGSLSWSAGLALWKGL